MDAYEIAKAQGRVYASGSMIRSLAPLSGEWADEVTIPEVYQSIEDELGRELTTDEYEWVLDDWEEGYNEHWDDLEGDN